MHPSRGHYLYPFLLKDPFTGRWYRTRWKAGAEEIEERGGKIDGAGEWVTPLEPHRDPRMAAQDRPLPGDRVEIQSSAGIDAREAMLVKVFLRRYATWCARSRRYAAMHAVRALYRELS